MQGSVIPLARNPGREPEPQQSLSDVVRLVCRAD